MLRKFHHIFRLGTSLTRVPLYFYKMLFFLDS